MRSSPFLHGSGMRASVTTLMGQVLLATLPGIAVLSYFFGFGVINNLLIASAGALGCEALALRLRGRSLAPTLKDCSALVTAFLIAIALPPYCPWWVVLSATTFAILIAKHVYGGLGYNPFNPAMVAYVFVLISFPVQMTTWAAPLGFEADYSPPGLIQSLQLQFGGGYEAITSATPLELVRNNPLSLSEIAQQWPVFGFWGGIGWEYVNLAFLLGGLYLLYRGVFTWHAPVGLLAAFSLLVVLFNSDNAIEMLLLQLFSGATMLGAFFIITDPVSSAVSNTGRLVYGIGAGILLFVMRQWSSYPDAIAFSVLLMNFVAPLIDYYTQPRTYGHR